MSTLQQGIQEEVSLVLVDTMGDLAGFYSVADMVFCGGSLVDKGGHNLMEAAIWRKAVLYGPFVSDFEDAAELLERAKAGFRVQNSAELQEKIRYFIENPEEYRKACESAGEVADLLQGGGQRQVDFVLSSFYLFFLTLIFSTTFW